MIEHAIVDVVKVGAGCAFASRVSAATPVMSPPRSAGTLQKLVKDLLDLALVALDMEWAIPAANELFKARTLLRMGASPQQQRYRVSHTLLLIQMATARLEGQSWKQVRAYTAK